MISFSKSATLFIVLFALIPITRASANNRIGLSPSNNATADASKEQALQAAVRKLWEDHITWTRIFIISAAADLSDKDAVTQRLLQNQVDIGNAIKPYYGNAAGDQLTALLKDHILISADV